MRFVACLPGDFGKSGSMKSRHMFLVVLFAFSLAACGEKKPQASSADDARKAVNQSEADRAVDQMKKDVGKAGDAVKEAFKSGGDALAKKTEEARIEAEKKAAEFKARAEKD